MKKLPPETFADFLKFYNDDDHRTDRTQRMEVKQRGGRSLGLTLIWTFEIDQQYQRPFQPEQRVQSAIKELNWHLWTQDKFNPQFELDSYLIKAGQAKLVFEIKLRRVGAE